MPSCQDVRDIVAVDHDRRQRHLGLLGQRPGVEVLDEGRLHVFAEGLDHLHHQLLATRRGACAGQTRASLLRQHRLHHVQVVHRGRIERRQRPREEVGLLLMVAFQADAVAGFDDRLQHSTMADASAILPGVTPRERRCVSQSSAAFISAPP